MSARFCMALALAFLGAGGCDPGSVSGDGSDVGDPGDDGTPGVDAGPDDPDGGGPGTPDAAPAPRGPTMIYAGGSAAAIHVFALDRATLALTPMGTTPSGNGPSFLAFDAAARWLVVVNEGAGGGAVQSFTIDPVTGALTLKDSVASGGAGPAHVGLDTSGGYMLVANYGGGTARVVPIDAAGDFGEPTATVSPGANAHQIIADAANTTIYVPCKGADHTMVYGFDAATGMLTPRTPAASADGAGPRHIALLPGGGHAYVVNELDSTIDHFAIGAQGALTKVGASVSTLPAGFMGANTGAEIAVHPSGKFVYSSNRGHDSIAVFSVDAQTGALTPAGHTPTGGDRPRHFSLIEGGSAMLVANQDTGNIVAFRVDPMTGALTAVGQVATVAGAQFVGALDLPAE